MTEYAQRLLEEKQQLDGRIQRLQDYASISLASFRNLPASQKILLKRQLALMVEYSEILGARIVSISNVPES